LWQLVTRPRAITIAVVARTLRGVVAIEIISSPAWLGQLKYFIRRSMRLIVANPTSHQGVLKKFYY
jgi:hypothetical protein